MNLSSKRAIFAGAAFLAWTLAQANTYTVVDLGRRRFASEIDDLGQIAATYDDPRHQVVEHPFVLRNGHWHQLSDGTASASTVDLNGTVGGVFQPDAYHAIPMTWTRDGKSHLFHLPDNANGGAVIGISNGHLVGNYYLSSGSYCFLGRPRGGEIQDMGVPLNMAGCYPAGINGYGQVAATSASPDNTSVRSYLWQDGEFTDLGTLPGALFTTAAALNDAGHVVGRADLGRIGMHAFLWKDGVMTDIGNDPTFPHTEAHAINNADMVVGYGAHTLNGPYTFFAVRFENGAVIDLNAETVNLGGWVLENATSINDQGVIVGNGWYQGLPHGFMLVPQANR